MGQINCSDDMLYEKKISEKDIFDGRVFKVKVRQIETPEGKPSTRELVFHNGGACVLPVDDEQNVYLVKQFRSPFERVLLEAPAGKIDPGEEPDESARRELKEETGLTLISIDDWIGESYSAVGFSNEKNVVIVGTASGEFEKSTSSVEEIEAAWFTKAEIRELLKTEVFAARTQAYCYLWSRE